MMNKHASANQMMNRNVQPQGSMMNRNVQPQGSMMNRSAFGHKG